MANKHKQIKLSVDLLSASKRYLDFVRDHLTVLDLRREEVVRAALYRYQHFWLPLAVKYPDTDLEAPEDIHWVWHCHMLSPLPYKQDCERLVGRVIGNESLLRTDEENAAALKESERLWQETYPPEHPFSVDISGPVKPEYRDGETNFNAHILSNALRQKEFDYQVSLPHYDDPGFIMSSVVRYKQFMYLKKVKPDMWVIPTYDIDFVWHAHQLCPMQYIDDNMNNLGFIHNHGDVPPGLPPDAKLHYPDIVTRVAWVEEFGEAVSLFGAGYRGENPVGKLDPMDKEELARTSPRDVTLVIKEVVVKTRHEFTKAAKVKLQTPMGVEKIPLHLKSLNRGSRKGVMGLISGQKKKSDFSVRFDTSISPSCLMTVSMLDKAFGPHNGSGTDVARIDMSPFVERSKADVTVPFETTLVVDDSTKLDMVAEAQPAKYRPALYSIQPGRKGQVAMTENLKVMWGPIPLPEEPLGRTDVPVETVTFKILDSNAQESFTCRLLDCDPLDQEGAQVFFHDSMVAVAHPIGGIQLPYPSHVSNKKATATLNPLKGEKGALIKNDQGDWGILVVHVKNERVAAPTNGVKEPKGVQLGEEKEYMHLVLWILEGHRRVEFKMPNEKNEHELILDGVTINLSTGTMMLDEPDVPVAECLAIAFVLKILWRQCRNDKKENTERMPINKLAQISKGLIMSKALKAFQN